MQLHGNEDYVLSTWGKLLLLRTSSIPSAGIYRALNCQEQTQLVKNTGNSHQKS